MGSGTSKFLPTLSSSRISSKDELVKKTKDMNSTIEKYKSLVENTINQTPIQITPLETSLEEKEIEDDLNRFLEQTLYNI